MNIKIKIAPETAHGPNCARPELRTARTAQYPDCALPRLRTAQTARAHDPNGARCGTAQRNAHRRQGRGRGSPPSPAFRRCSPHRAVRALRLCLLGPASYGRCVVRAVRRTGGASYGPCAVRALRSLMPCVAYCLGGAVRISLVPLVPFVGPGTGDSGKTSPKHRRRRGTRRPASIPS